MSEQKWVRSSLRHLSKRLADLGHRVSPPTVGKLLRQLGYSLRVNVKKHEGSSAHPDRNTQFEHIQAQKEHFQAVNCPIISVDTKKKELIGNFKNAGRAWKERPEAVNAHDFPQDAIGKAVPYGIYDVLRNCGTVYVGSSADTPAFVTLTRLSGVLKEKRWTKRRDKMSPKRKEKRISMVCYSRKDLFYLQSSTCVI